MAKTGSDHRYIDRFRVLTEVSRQISSVLDINQLLSEIVRLIQTTFGYYHVGIGLIEGDEVCYRVGAGSLVDRMDFQFKPARLKVGKEGISGYVAAVGKPLLIPDVSQEPRYVIMQDSQTRSELTVPIIIKSQVIGVLDIQSEKLDNFDEIDLELMTSLANQAGAAIENARLFAEEQRRVEQFRVISEVGRHIVSILDLQELLDQLSNSIQRAFNYPLVEIGLVEADELVFVARSDPLGDSVFEPFRLKVNTESVTGWVAVQGEPLVVPNVGQEPRYVQVSQYETRSELAVPIIAKDRVIGVLNIQSDQLDAFDKSDVELMQILANQAGVAIENSRLYAQAKQVAVLEERQRLARDLHDSVTQALYGMGVYSQAASGQLTRGDLGKTLEYLHEIQNTVQEALAEMRLLVYELRPPVLEEEGLAGALRARLSSVEDRAGLKTILKYELPERLPVPVEETLYRIAQEALNNSLKHANAQTIQVSVLQKGHTLVMELSDDGVGFDTTQAVGAGYLGLEFMRERAKSIRARIDVRSQPGKGTRIRVEMKK